MKPHIPGRKIGAETLYDKGMSLGHDPYVRQDDKERYDYEHDYHYKLHDFSTSDPYK